MKDKISDEDLMLAYVNGEYSAFETLYQRHAKTVFGFLTKKLNSKEAAEDVLQETFLRMHRFRGKFNSSLPFLPWLFTICRNALIDKVRNQSKVQEQAHADLESISEETLVTSNIFANEASAFSINELGASLSTKEQEVLSLRYGEDFSFNKIAESLGMNPPAVRKMTQRAIEKLRKLWS